jgi:hypothetical protein
VVLEEKGSAEDALAAENKDATNVNTAPHRDFDVVGFECRKKLSRIGFWMPSFSTTKASTCLIPFANGI